MIIDKSKQHTLAVLGILYSSTMWGLIWYPMRQLEQAGMNVVWTTLTVYLAAALLASVYLCRHWQYMTRWPLSLWCLAISAGTANIAILVALIEGQVMRVTLLFYLSPLLSVILSRWWLGERISGKAILLMLLALSGMLLMLWHPEVGIPWPRDRADWLAILSCVMFSINNVLSRKLADVSMLIKTTVVYWGVVLAAAGTLLWQSIDVPAVSYESWFSIFIVGGIFFTSMTVAVLYGLGRMPVFRSSVLMLFQLLVAAVSAWLLTNESMSQMEIIGGVLITLAAYGIARTGR